jgi:hypothetical protein
MAESSESALQQLFTDNINEDKENKECSSFEPEKKKLKIDQPAIVPDYKLEERLSGILCCAVCLDLPRTCFQVNLVLRLCAFIKLFVDKFMLIYLQLFNIRIRN